MLEELHSFKFYESRFAVWSWRKDIAIEVGMQRYANTSVQKARRFVCIQFGLQLAEDGISPSTYRIDVGFELVIKYKKTASRGRINLKIQT